MSNDEDGVLLVKIWNASSFFTALLWYSSMIYETFSIVTLVLLEDKSFQASYNRTDSKTSNSFVFVFVFVFDILGSVHRRWWLLCSRVNVWDGRTCTTCASAKFHASSLLYDHILTD